MRTLLFLVVALAACAAPRYEAQLVGMQEEEAPQEDAPPPIDEPLRARYYPFHPANQQQVHFEIAARDEKRIARAELFLFEYELTETDGEREAVRREGGRWGLVQAWDYPDPVESLRAGHVVEGFSAHTRVTCVVQVVNTEGDLTQEIWSFAAGDWPYGNTPIPLWVDDGPANKRIDLCFVADRASYETARDMLGNLSHLVYEGFFASNGVRAWRRYWHLYYSPQRGHISDFDDAEQVLDVPASVRAAGADCVAIVHMASQRDWAKGNTFGTEPYSVGTAVHEAAHAVFDLADEYPGGSHFASTKPHHNNYISKWWARYYNSKNGWPKEDVEKIEKVWYRPEPHAMNCIMRVDEPGVPDFGRTCLRRVRWVYKELEKGQ